MSFGRKITLLLALLALRGLMAAGAAAAQNRANPLPRKENAAVPTDWLIQPPKQKAALTPSPDGRELKPLTYGWAELS